MRYFLFVLILAILPSCGNKKNAEIDALETEVMRVHDESMLGMSDLKSIKTALAKIDSKDLPAETKAALTAARNELALADSLMWDWMHNYSDPGRSDKEFAEAYFKEELKKITKVDALMNSSIEKGNQLFEQLKANKNEE